MNILQIFPGKVWGGAEQYVLDLGVALSRLGHGVHYAAYDNRAILDRVEENVMTFPFRGICDWNTITRLARFVQEKNIDLIHIHDTRFVPMVILAKKYGKRDVRVVLTRHIARASRVFPFYRNLFRSLHCVIFVSDLARKMWYSVNTWMPREKIHVVLNSIPDVVEESGYESLRQKYQIPNNIPLIVFTGRIRRSKGCAVLLEALAALKNLPYHVVFVGSCKPKDYISCLSDMAKHYGISDRVSFYGFSRNVRLLIKDSDIGAAPSIVRESCHLSAMEFMQAGKCVITTTNGAQSEYISSGETGMLVSPKSANELAEALAGLLNNMEECRRIGERAKTYFESNLNYSRFIQHIVDCYSIPDEM